MGKAAHQLFDLTMGGINLVTSGFLLADFAGSLVDYQTQAEAITSKIYSAASTITPEVAEQARQLISQLADQPNCSSAIVGAITGVLGICFVSKSVNAKNYIP